MALASSGEGAPLEALRGETASRFPWGLVQIDWPIAL